MRSIKTILFSLFFILLTTHELTAQPIIPCKINTTSRQTGTVAACMMFQNEARFLKEWLEYHKSIGVTHFYLYNNASDDGFWEVLMPYVINGQVELYDLYEKTSNCQEHNNLQRQVYNHAVRVAKGNFEWLAIIDSDEFICMPNDNNLGKFLESYLYGTGLAVNWVMYGSSNVQSLGSNDLQIEHLVYRAQDNCPEHFLCKSIVRPTYVLEADIHTCTYHPDMPVHPNHQKFSHTPNFETPPIDKIRINHYWWRDEQYFQEIKRPRRSGWLAHYTDAEVDKLRKTYNAVYDPSMVPFVKKTKMNMSLSQ